MTLRNLSLFATVLTLPGIVLCQRSDAQTLAYRAVKEWPLPATSAVGAPGSWKAFPIDQAYVTVRLEPGSGSQLEFKMTRYAHQPTLAQPWDLGWMVKR